MKKLCPAILVLLFASLSLLAQRGEHTTVYEPPAEPNFTVHKGELNHLVSTLDDWINCQDFDPDFSDLFLDKPECLEFVKFLDPPEYEKAGPEMASLFHRLSSEAKSYFLQQKSTLSRIELVATKKRLGSPKEIEIVTTYLNLFFDDGSGMTIKVGLVFHDGRYQIINLDN